MRLPVPRSVVLPDAQLGVALAPGAHIDAWQVANDKWTLANGKMSIQTRKDKEEDEEEAEK